MSSEGGVVLNIHEMIDLAIGTPEVGVVDFCMLQTLLHCLAQQIRCSEKTVELKGSVGILPVGRIPENAPTLAIVELPLETDGVPAEAPGGGQDTILIVERVARGSSGGIPSAGRAAGTGGKAGTGRVESAEPRSAQRADAASKDVDKNGSKVASKDGAKSGKVSGKGNKGSKGTSEDSETGDASDEGSAAPDGKAVGKAGAVPKAAPGTTAAVPPASTGLPPASLVTLSKFNLLESAVNDLKDRVYGSMPKNEAILEGVRSQTNIKAITDMWTNLNVSSRLEAAEEGISKLSSLLQDLIRSTADPTLQSKAEASAPSTTSPGKAAPGGTSPGATASSMVAPGTTSPDATGTAATAPATISPGAVYGAPGYTDPEASAACLAACENKVVALVNELQELRLDHDQLSNMFQTAMKQMDHAVAPPRQRGEPAQAEITLESLSTPAGTTATPELDKGQKSPVSSLPAPGVPGAGLSGSGAPISDAALAAKVAALASRLDELEKKQYQLHADVFNPNLGSLQEQISSLQDQMDYFTKHAAGGMPSPTPVAMGEGLDKLPPELAKDLQGLMQLFQTVQGMQNQLREVHDTALQLAAEREEKQHNIKSLLEQIELLKSIKLDREDMVEALADKADLRLLARKVSHDQFEMACDDLSKGLEHALGKLNIQESLWQQALDDIQREIETKLDKIELAPVKEFFNNKLKQLQENLKQMADLRKQAHAAGTKRKLLMDVNCISCDANAVMETVHTAGGGPRPLPAHMSIKPYLSYELDAIRKAQQSNLPQRNLHDWETINKTPASPQKQPHKVRSDTDKHICNRYCGGSHTTTTPAQRVARTGHFVKQWGPEVLPLSSEFATGDDGRLYKVTASKLPEAGPGGAADVPCTPMSKSKEQQKPKPLGTSPECRCLEERLTK